MRQSIPLALLLAGAAIAPAGAQELVIPAVNYPDLPEHAVSAEGFVPSGWALELQVAGDLNDDGGDDLAFVLHANDPANVVANEEGFGEDPLDTNPRILAVAFADPAAGYVLQLENHTLIPRRTVPTLEDPLAANDLAIERGALRVRLDFFASAGGWEMWSATYTFRHRDGRFELIGFDRDSMHRGSGDRSGISVNFSTGKLKRWTGHIDSDNTQARWESLPVQPPLTIEQVGDGLAFDPEA